MAASMRMFSLRKTIRNTGSRRIWFQKVPQGCRPASGTPPAHGSCSLASRPPGAAKLGLWGEPVYVMGKAEDHSEVLKSRGQFTLVEGRVLSVRESGGTIYVNFGRRWSEDFTVTIAKRNERVFTAAGLEPKSLSGRRVRVRGWIEERGGPWVEAARPEQIEVLEK